MLLHTGDPDSKDKVTRTLTGQEVVAASRSHSTYSSLLENTIVEESESSDMDILDQENHMPSTSPTSDDSVFHPSPEKTPVPPRKYGKVHFVDINGDREAGKAIYSNRPKESLRTDRHTKHKKSKRKQILKNVSVYFNTSELVAIMGPSGCGKTTLLDLLTGRRKQGYRKVCITDN